MNFETEIFVLHAHKLVNIQSYRLFVYDFRDDELDMSEIIY